MQQSNQNKLSEKHIFSEQTSPHKSKTFRLKNLHFSRDTNEIVLHIIKQCLKQFIIHVVARTRQATPKRHSNHQSTDTD